MTSHQPTTIPYEQDYCLWLGQNLENLQAKRFNDIDIENLVEELRDMGRSQRDALESNLQIVLMHLLKYQYQSEKRSNSWRYTLLEHRDRLETAFKHSPSLKTYLLNVFEECYLKARRKVSVETGLDIDIFPLESPFSMAQVLELDYLPDQLFSWIKSIFPQQIEVNDKRIDLAQVLIESSLGQNLIDLAAIAHCPTTDVSPVLPKMNYIFP